MKNKLIKLFSLAAIVCIFASCQAEYEKEYSWAYPLCGDWTVLAYIGDTEIYGPIEIRTYNTSFGQDSIWVDDYQYSFWVMKFKVAVDMNAKTFQSQGSVNAVDGYPILITTTNGVVVGNDSISMELEFEDDPGTIYTLKGHRTTSVEEYYTEY